MATHDPDAIWKPGYAGELAYHPVTRPQMRPPRRRRAIGLGLGLVAAVTMSVFIVLRLTASGDTATSGPLDRIPAQIHERWTATLEGPVGAVTGTNDLVVVRAGRELVAFDAGSGIERWRAPAPSELGELEVLDAAVVYHDVSGRTESLAGFDVRDGRRLWSRTLRDGPRVRLGGGSLVVADFTAGGVVDSLAVLDPRTGRRLAAFEGDEITMSSTAIRRRIGDVVEWYDRKTFELRDRIDLSILALDGVRTAGAPTDAGLVIATFDRAWLLDGDGAILSTVSFSQQLTAPWSLDELDGSGHYVMLQGLNATTLLTVRDGGLHEVWTRPVTPVDWMFDFSRTILAVRQSSDEAGGLQVIDASRGRAIFSGRQPRLFGPALGANGFVAGTEPSEDGSWSVVGYDFDGAELWRLRVPASGWPILLPGALLTVDQDADARAVTLTLLA